MEQFRKLNRELNRIELDPKYAFAFTHNDGFSYRLFSAQFSIDWNYNFTLEMDSSECKDKPISQFHEKGKLSGAILDFAERLMESKYYSLKSAYQYDNLSIDDIGHQQYLLNFDKETIVIYIIDGLPKDYFETETEQLLYDFNEYLKKMIANKYAAWLAN